PTALCSCHRDGVSRGRPSFPTRRSSDLATAVGAGAWSAGGAAAPGAGGRLRGAGAVVGGAAPGGRGRAGRPGVAGDARGRDGGRSEEHTSELQSRENLVCRLLLEKKKQK